MGAEYEITKSTMLSLIRCSPFWSTTQQQRRFYEAERMIERRIYFRSKSVPLKMIMTAGSGLIVSRSKQ